MMKKFILVGISGLVLAGILLAIIIRVSLWISPSRFVFAGESVAVGQQEILAKTIQHDPFTRQLAKLILKTEGKALVVNSNPIDGFVATKKFNSQHGPIEYTLIEGADGSKRSDSLVTIVGFNGLFSSVEAQAAVMKFLGVQKYRGIFVNAPGHLGTYSPAGVTFKQWVEDVCALLQNEKADNVIGFGSSLGGHRLYIWENFFRGRWSA